jgi:hypothetical protein
MTVTAVVKAGEKVKTAVVRDPFHPVFVSPNALDVSDEQKSYIREVLNTACSDIQFAHKAYDALLFILTTEEVPPPAITTLTPSTVVIGDPSFTLHVHGTGFDSGSIITFAGVDEPTTLVSSTEVTTGVNMSLWVGPDLVPVTVKNVNGAVSNSVNFGFTASVGTTAAKKSDPAAHTDPSKTTTPHAITTPVPAPQPAVTPIPPQTPPAKK